MKFIFASIFGLIATVAVTVTAQNCTPGLTRQVLPHPSRCNEYFVCAFGNPSTFTCPVQTPNFDACSLSCSTSNANCFTCNNEQTTTTTTTTTIGETTSTPSGETTSTLSETTTTTTVPGEDTTTTSSIPSAPTVIPTVPTVNPN